MGSVYRVPAAEVETVVNDAVRCEVPTAVDVDHRELIGTHVARIEVQSHKLLVELKTLTGPQPSEDDADRKVIQIPWQKPPSKRKREIILPNSDSSNDTRPIRADARARLVAAIARGRRWLEELVTSAVTDIDAIAARERRSVRKVSMTISLAFLAPALVQAAIEGRLPRGIGIARLSDSAAEWSRQHQELGLPVP